jgi:4-carboxymuconolactone decarboxylase
LDLLAVAAAIAAGDDAATAVAMQHAGTGSMPPVWVDELLLQSVLMVGWPRALTAAATWRQVSGLAAPDADPDEDYARAAEWRRRGEETCRLVYGTQYDRLRANVRRLHPALDAWMLMEGYGRTLGRPGLDPRRRELCTVAQCAVLGVPRQLHSHLRGARQAGASVAEIEAALSAARPYQGPAAAAAARAVWEALRS